MSYYAALQRLSVQDTEPAEPSQELEADLTEAMPTGADRLPTDPAERCAACAACRMVYSKRTSPCTDMPLRSQRDIVPIR
jgi:hypothetical protein